MNEPNEIRRSPNRANLGVGRHLAARQPQSFWGTLLVMVRALLNKAMRYHLQRSG